MAVDLSPNPTRTPEDVATLVAVELARFEVAELAEAFRCFIVVPREEQRSWDYSNDHPEVITWVVAESQRYDYGIVYAERGFGPAAPWGLIFSSQPNIGTDNAWYASLESAFAESRLLEEHRERSG